MQVKRLDPLVIELREVQDGIKDFLLLSDVHFDHPYCDRKMFFRLMDQAKAKNAKVFFNGDFFCMMQARGDKRGAKNSVRPEHQGANYFDLVINEAAELLKPYAENIELLGDGNHETAIQKWNEINPLDRLASIIKYETGHQIHRAGYHGFIKTRIQHHVKTGTFKDEFNVPGGFGVERLNKPAAIGGYWMRVELSADADRNISARFQVANDF
jgi:hypothetical protein